MAEIGDRRVGACIGLAVGDPQRRVVAAGIERVDLRPVFLVADECGRICRWRDCATGRRSPRRGRAARRAAPRRSRGWAPPACSPSRLKGSPAGGSLARQACRRLRCRAAGCRRAAGRGSWRCGRGVCTMSGCVRVADGAADAGAALTGVCAGWHGGSGRNSRLVAGAGLPDRRRRRRRRRRARVRRRSRRANRSTRIPGITNSPSPAVRPAKRIHIGISAPNHGICRFDCVAARGTLREPSDFVL